MSGAAQDVQGDRDNKRFLSISSDTYTATTTFVDVPAGFVTDGYTDGVCALRVPDLSRYDPSVTEASIAATLRNALAFTGLVRRFVAQVHKRTLGVQHHDHYFRFQLSSEVFATNLLNADGTLNASAIGGLQWGRNSPSTGDFMRVDLVSGDPNDPTSTRVFELSLGTIRMVGRLGPGASDPTVSLLCDVLAGGEATLTVE